MNKGSKLARPVGLKAVATKLLQFACGERGSALVEFAITVTMLMTLTVSAIGFSLAMYSYHFVSSAAQQGVRFAIVRGYIWNKSCSTSAPPGFTVPYGCTASSSDIQNYVQSLAPVAINQSSVTINTTSSYIWPGQTPTGSTSGCTTANSQGCVVKVTVNCTFNFFGIQKLSSLSMSATSQGVILQ